MLCDRFGADAAQVKCFGIGGQNSYEGLGRLDWLTPFEPHLVLLEFGLNDCGFHPIPPAATHLAMRSLVEGVRVRLGADAVIVAAGGDNPQRPRLPHWNATQGALRDVAAECAAPLADVRSAMLHATKCGAHWGAFRNGEDDVHPNDAGHTIWAKAVFDTLVSALPQN